MKIGAKRGLEGGRKNSCLAGLDQPTNRFAALHVGILTASHKLSRTLTSFAAFASRPTRIECHCAYEFRIERTRIRVSSFHLQLSRVACDKRMKSITKASSSKVRPITRSSPACIASRQQMPSTKGNSSRRTVCSNSMGK